MKCLQINIMIRSPNKYYLMLESSIEFNTLHLILQISSSTTIFHMFLIDHTKITFESLSLKYIEIQNKIKIISQTMKTIY